MPEAKILDFDASGPEKTRDFVRTFFEHAREAQQYKMEEFARVNKIVNNQLDMEGRDPNRANIFVPKAQSTIETIVPYQADALFGLRPFIPIELKRKEYGSIGGAMTDLLDMYLDDANFLVKGLQLLKYVAPYGLGFIEATPDYVERTIKTMVPELMTLPDGTQVLVGARLEKQKKFFFQLGVRVYAPWEVYKDPFAKNLEECRGIIKFRGFTSKRELKKMAERGAFPDFDVDRLDADMATFEQDDWSKRIAQDLGVSIPKTDDDMGAWISFESNDRYIDMWNFTTVLRDIPNPYEHGKINLTRVVNGQNYNPWTEWWGQGEIKPIEQLVHALNENWNQTFDNHNMQNEGIIFYDEDAFNVDQLVMIPGNRIPTTLGAGKSVNDVIQERVTPGLQRDHYAIPEKLEDMIDMTTGVNEIIRGEAAKQSRTAREAIMMKSAGEARMKLKVKLCERMGFGDFGLKALSIIDQFATADDIIDKIGVERAMMLPTVNPMAIDGGFHFTFKGSDRMSEAQMKRQDAKDVFQISVGQPSVRQDWLMRFLLEKFDVNEDELRDAIIPDEVVAQLQQMALEQAAQAELMQKAGGGAPSARSVSNGSVIGGSGGNTPFGRSQNENLGLGI